MPADATEPSDDLARQIRAYLRQLRIERGGSVNTVAAYRRDLELYSEWLRSQGVSAPAEVSPERVREFAHYLSAERVPALATSSRARVLSAVRGWHKYLVEEGDAVRDPTTDLAAPKIPRLLPHPLTIAETVELIESVSSDDPLSLRDRAILETLYGTGARVAELTALDVDDIGDPEYVRLFGKGQKERIVPLGGMARAALDAYLVRARPSLAVGRVSTPALFIGARGARLSRQSVWLVLKGRAERAGITSALSPHTLRHSFATHLLAGGADVRVVQELLGHASPVTTQIYTKVTVDSLREIYATSHPRAR